MKLYVVRHAEADHNLTDIANDQTSTKVHLTPKGIEQAKRRAKDLEMIHFDAIFTSEQDRAIETAKILSSSAAILLRKDARLNDIRTGMQGRPFDEFRKALAESEDPWNARFNDGESFEDEKQRTLNFLQDLKAKPYKQVLIVTHGGVANIMYGMAHHLTNEQTFNRPIDNAVMFMFEL